MLTGLTVLIFLGFTLPSDADFWSQLQLPEEHIPYYFYNNKAIKQKCAQDDSCPYKDYLDVKKCWGYEKHCPPESRMSSPECPQDVSGGWAKTKQSQKEKFWIAGDFGYIKERKDEWTVMCEPETPDDSMLACVQYARYCRATNIYMDFSKFNFETSKNRYQEDVFSKPGTIGGHCKLYKDRLKEQSEHKSPLQSWFAELEQYDSLDFKPVEDNRCDIVLEKPTLLIKLDAGINMYHHFCDFVNLYVSQHMNNSFDLDVNIVMWDTSSYTYGDFFRETWKAFSNHPIIELKNYNHKKVCIKDAVFSYLPRMRRGLYYNMPLIPGCHSSSLMRAFSQQVVHRLNLPQEGPLRDKIRITLLSRSTKYRKIMNQKELVKALETVDEYEVQVVDFHHKMPFLDQLPVTVNSDIFIGMHGAGLTHMLFQPDWGVLFELYNCEDEHCYYDLARLRGLHYMTWKDKDKLVQEDEGHHPTLGAHAKFTNYAFDVKEFMGLISKGVEYIKDHPKFQEAWRKKYQTKDEL